MRGQVFCRVGTNTRATDLAGPVGETIGGLKLRILGVALNALGADRLHLVHEGRWLSDTCTVAAARVHSGSTVQLAFRALRGGGGDGGATGAESRSCYLEMYADNGGTGFSRKMERLGGFMKYKTQSTVRDRDEREEDLARWFNCTLTEEPLEDGEGAVVVDRLGSLFNKEPVLKALRDKAVDGVALPQRLEHITGMKAITTLKLHRAESRKSSVKDSSGNVNAATCRLDAESRFSCPISGLDFNGKFKFFALVPSGIVVSDRAMREAKAAVHDLIVGAGLEDQTLVPINPKGDELDAMKEALDGEAEKKAAKKKKKEAKRGHAVVGGGGSPDDTGTGAGTERGVVLGVGGAKGGGAGDDAVKWVELVRGTGIKSLSKREWNGCDDLSNEQLKAQAKRWRAADHAPEGVNKDVYASLFTGTDAHTREQETFLSRNARKAW
mmetsp:Transcript_4059/g.9909  ORF Transcript_4059/g.9909 Transcript_4059/m.9909 type:complete len:440 (-) Transcript_4059:390-1709(-)